MPHIYFDSPLFLFGGYFLMTIILSLSEHILSSLIMRPNNLIFLTENLHLFSFKMMILNFSKIILNRLSCSTCPCLTLKYHPYDKLYQTCFPGIVSCVFHNVLTWTKFQMTILEIEINRKA